MLLLHPVRTGQDPDPKVLAAMTLFLFLLFVLLAVAAAAGLTADSRDGADWAATVDGWRQPTRFP
jgi:hypothetical protein